MLETNQTIVKAVKEKQTQYGDPRLIVLDRVVLSYEGVRQSP